MTDADMRNEIGGVAEELAMLRKTRACLRSKAERFSEMLDALRARLSDARSGRFGIRYSTEIPRDEWPTYDEIEALHAELRSVEARIPELEGRLREWGVIGD